MPTKQEDIHTHAVLLPSGEELMTGPPIGETHEEMAEPVAPEPEPKRAPGRKAEAPVPATSGQRQRSRGMPLRPRIPAFSRPTAAPSSTA